MVVRLTQVWIKLPVVLRAIPLGVVVLLVGLLPWSALADANLKAGTAFPWASFVGFEVTFAAGVHQSGLNLSFAVAVSLTLVLGTVAALAFWKLAKVRRVQGPGQNEGAQ